MYVCMRLYMYVLMSVCVCADAHFYSTGLLVRLVICLFICFVR